MKKRILSVIMVLSMCLSMLPPAAFAAEDTGLCEHHPEHTEECGWAEAVAGVDCTHEHTADCYTNGVLPEGNADSSNAYELEGDTEPTNTLACTHTHDEGCGYVEAAEASPCTYECGVCTVQELIDALPDEVTAENAEMVAVQLDAIDHGKSYLTDEELTLLDLTKYTAASQTMGALAAAEVICTCGSEDNVHATNCPAYVAPENPECFCAEKCTEGTINVWCDICGVKGVEACEGTDTAVPYADYTVTIDKNITNGSVTAQVGGSDVTQAAEGATVTLTATPDEGYELDTLTVTDASGAAVTVTNGTFTMTAANVTVTATFKAAAAVETTIYVGGYTEDDGSGGTTAKPLSTNTKYVVATDGTVSVGNDTATDYFVLTGDETSGYTLTVTGEVTITQQYTVNSVSYGIYNSGETLLTITGTGTLNVGTADTVVNTGIRTYDSLTIQTVTINVNSEQAGIRVQNSGETLSIKSATVTAKSQYSAGIYSYGTFVMNGGTLEASGNYYGIFADDGITLDNGVVKTSGAKGIQMGSGGTFSLSDNVHLKAEGTDAAISVNQDAADLSNLTTGTSYYWRTGTTDQFIANPVYGNSGTYFEYVGANHVTKDETSNTISCTDENCPIKISNATPHTHDVAPTYSVNADDSTKHDRTYSCCNHTAVEEHSMDASGKCACGATAGVSVTADGATTYYDSLTNALGSDAVSSANSTDTIVTLLTDVDYSEGDAPVIDYSLTLDLNGRTITTSMYGWSFSSSGSIIIRDSAGNGKIITDGTNTILEWNIDSLTLQSGTIGEEDNPQATGISVYGGVTFNMTGGTVYGLDVETGSTVTLGAGVTISGTGLNFDADYVNAESYITVNGQPNGTIEVYKFDGGVFAKPGTDVTLDPAWFTTYQEGYAVVQEGDDLALRKLITDEMVALSEAEYTYNGSEQKPTVTVTGQDNGGNNVTLTANTNYTVSYKRGENVTTDCTSAGEITVVVTGMGDYTGTVEKTYTIKTAELTVTGATATDREYDGTSTVTITGVTLDGVVNSDAVSVNTTDLTGTLDSSNEGTYSSVTLPALTLTGVAKDNYTLTQPTAAVSTTVTISPKSISDAVITLGDSLTYTGQQQTQAISSVTVDDVNLTADTDYTVTNNTGTNAGENYTLTITGKGNYTGTTTKAFSIGKANASVTTAPTAINPTYNGTAQALINAGTAEGGEMQYAVGDAAPADDSGWTTTVPTGTNADTYTVWYRVKGDANHNDSAAASVTVTIAPAPLTISGATLAEKTYDGDGTATVTGVTFNGLQNSETLTLGTGYTATAEFTDPNAGTGTKTANVTVTLANSNYSLADNTLELSGQTIKQATAPTMTATATIVKNQANYTVRLDLTEATGYPATPGGTPTFTVQTGTYNGLTSANLDADGKTLVLVADNTQNSTDDTVTVNFTDIGNYTDGTITVTISYTDKTPVTITGVSAATGLTYNGSAQQGYTGIPSSAYTGTYEITYTGRGSTTYGPSAAAPTNAGDYTVTFKVPDSNQTYTGSTSLNFSIAKKQITVPTQPAAVTYNGGAQTYGVTATSDYTVSGGVQTNANETGYDVTIALTDTANTEWATGGTADVTQKFIINKAAITVTADDKSAIVGATQPTLTYTVSGLQGTDQLTTAPSLSCTPDMNTVGEYTITISGAEQDSGNYTISHVNGKLTVSNKTTPTLTLTPSSASLSGGGTVTLTVGGLPTGGNVTITCDNTTYNPTGSGTTWSVTLPNTTAAYVFTASFAGDDTHNSATATCTVNVTRYTSGGGGGYTPPSTPPTQSVTVPISGDDNTIHVGASVTGDKATVDEVDLSKLDTVIGDDVQIGTVTIDFSVLDTSEPISTVEIPADVVKQIAAAVTDPANDAESLEVILSDGTSIEFDAVALGEKAAQADGLDITISIEHHENAELTGAQKDAVGDRPAYDINVTSGGKHISDMGGKITVHAPYELKPGEKPRGIVVWYVDDHGNRERCETSYDQQRKRVNWKTDHLSLYMIDYDEALAEACDGGENCPSAKFIDVDTSLWYHEAIDYAIENGLMGGYGNGYFGPNDHLSRGMLAQILYNLEGRSAVSGDMPFTDVAADRYYFDAILWAQQNGIVGGYGGGLFGPDDPITREQLAVMLWRYAGSPAATKKELDFTDADEAGSWAVEALIWAQENGVMVGNNNAVDPKGNATRSHVAQMLMRFIESVITGRQDAE